MSKSPIRDFLTTYADKHNKLSNPSWSHSATIIHDSAIEVAETLEGDQQVALKAAFKMFDPSIQNITAGKDFTHFAEGLDKIAAQKDNLEISDRQLIDLVGLNYGTSFYNPTGPSSKEEYTIGKIGNLRAGFEGIGAAKVRAREEVYEETGKVFDDAVQRISDIIDGKTAFSMEDHRERVAFAESLRERPIVAESQSPKAEKTTETENNLVAQAQVVLFYGYGEKSIAYKGVPDGVDNDLGGRTTKALEARGALIDGKPDLEKLLAEVPEKNQAEVLHQLARRGANVSEIVDQMGIADKELDLKKGEKTDGTKIAQTILKYAHKADLGTWGDYDDGVDSERGSKPDSQTNMALALRGVSIDTETATVSDLIEAEGKTGLGKSSSVQEVDGPGVPPASSNLSEPGAETPITPK